MQLLAAKTQMVMSMQIHGFMVISGEYNSDEKRAGVAPRPKLWLYLPIGMDIQIACASQVMHNLTIAPGQHRQAVAQTLIKDVKGLLNPLFIGGKGRWQ